MPYAQPLSDLEMVRDSLESLKQLAGLYNHAATESTNPGVRDFFQQLHSQEVHSAGICFSFMHTRGAYPVQMAAADQLAKLRQHYAEVARTLPDQPGRPGVPAEETQRRRQTPAATAGISEPGQPH